MPETGGIVAGALVIGGVLGLILRRIPMTTLFAATTDNPWIITALAGAVSTLFLALGKVAQLLLQRTDKSHAELIERLVTSQVAELAGKDAVIAQYQARLEESEARANRYEDRTIKLLEATREAAAVTAKVVAKGGGL
jgi:hypothetical protein